MQTFRGLHFFVYLADMKRTLTLITLLLVLLPAAAQVRIVHKGAMTGCFKPGHPGGTAAEKEAIDLAAHFFLAESLTRTAPWAKAVRKGDIVLCETDTEEYGEDSCRIVIDNRNVRIYGHGKGLVYGTVEFLKKYVGIDYWGAGESYEPLHKELVLDPVDTVITPTFRYRQSQNYMLRTDPLYKTWYHLEEPSEVFVANYWVHTCDRLLPASRYGAEHPEYYAYYNGKRNPGSASQWCLSNPEVLEIVCERLDSLFKAYPDRKMISISQNDGSDTYCRCPECTRIMEEEGGPSGPILRFINAVADRFPDKEISTLAYLFSVQPPRKTVPRENVSIMLCDIDCRRQTALTENPSGQEFMKALEGWSKICKNLFVWDYGINFDNYLSPFPNLSTIKDNMVIFRDHHVKMHFSQIASVRGGDFAELRSYLVNNLMWDAGASLDSLEHRFLSRYYGKAGWPIYKYIKLMEGAAVGTDVDLFIYDSPVSYKNNILRPELMRRYNALFDEAEAAVADDPVRLARVRRTRLPLQYSALEIARTEVAGDPVRLARVRRTRLPLQYSALEIARTEPDRDPEAIGRALDLFQDRTLEFEVEMLNERHNTPMAYCMMYRSRYLGDSKDNLAFGKPVTYLVQPRPKYQKLGETALTDGIYGGTTYVESWVGWEGTDGAFLIDLGAPTAIHSISADFLHQLGAWILLPKQVKYSVSLDGERYRSIAAIDIPESRATEVAFVPVEATCDCDARYIRVDITGVKTCPEWHYGVGNPCWFFLDEVIVK